jgi:hypothetical protein
MTTLPGIIALAALVIIAAAYAACKIGLRP